MNIEDVIRELRVNPDKVFKWGYCKVKFISDILVYTEPQDIYGHTVKMSKANLNAEWSEVLNPVTFMTAVNSGKKIAHSTGEYKDIRDNLKGLSRYACEGNVKSILNGKWYIE